MKPFQYIRPKTIKEAVQAVADDSQARYIAGGTNLLDLMKRDIEKPEKLVDINHLPLKKIEVKSGVLRIGSLALNSAVSHHAQVVKRFPLLVQALLAGASGQIRNMATAGGNLLQQTRCPYFYDTAFPCNKRSPGTGCSAINGISRLHAVYEVDISNPQKACIAVNPSDMAVALMALDASIMVSGKNGERKMALDELYHSPATQPNLDHNLEKGDLITAVELPHAPLAQHAHYLKVRDRTSYAFALVSAAVALDIRDHRIQAARITLGGVAYKPWRLPAVEKQLLGQPISITAFRDAGVAALTDTRSFEHNAYKLKLIPNVIAEALKIASGLS